MNELEIVVLIFAALSVMALNWGENRWVGFMTACLAVLAATGLLNADGQYSRYLIFIPQLLLMLILSSFFCRGFYQLILLAAALAIATFTVLFEHAFVTNVYNDLSYFLILSLVFSALPLFIYSLQQGYEAHAEKLMAIQQLWLRLSFLYWVRENQLNLHHYEFYQDLLLGMSVYAAFVILLRVALGRGITWAFGGQVFFTIFAMTAALGLKGQHHFLLFLWIVAVAAGQLMPQVSCGGQPQLQRFLRRADYGGAGGAVFFASLYIVSVTQPVEYSLLVWTGLVFALGFFALIRPLQQAVNTVGSPHLKKTVLTARLFFQVVLIGVVLSWPFIMSGRNS